MLKRLLLSAAMLLLVGCNIFPEMHYSPAQRRGEPARLSAPSDAVPVTGAAPRYTFAEATQLNDPTPASPDRLQRGTELYRVNCSMCHGGDGRAQTLVAERFRAADAIPPVDLVSARVTTRTDGQLYWLIANGIGSMPPFGPMLSEEELWTLVRVIRQLGPR